jgi:hypothetical protein
MKNELAELRSRALSAAAPRKKPGFVRWLWPQIVAATNAGYTLKEIWEAIAQASPRMSYSRFTELAARMRRQQPAAPPTPIAFTPPVPVVSPAPTPTERPNDPFLNLRIQREKRKARTFEYNPFPDPDLLK